MSQSRGGYEESGSREGGGDDLAGAGSELADEGRNWRSTYGVGPGCMVLVRPDGHVAWRAETSPDAGDVTSAIRTAAGWR